MTFSSVSKTQNPEAARTKPAPSTTCPFTQRINQTLEAPTGAVVSKGPRWAFSDISVLVPERQKAVPTPAMIAIGETNDQNEYEAEKMADGMMRLPEPSSHSQEGGARQGSSLAAKAPPIVHQALGSHGQPLDTATRSLMESRFGYDFSPVRIHHDALAARSAEAVDAHAYTVNSNIVFGAGRYAPASQEGQRLLAHELTHVVQQSTLLSPGLAAGSSSGLLQRSPAPKRYEQSKRALASHPQDARSLLSTLPVVQSQMTNQQIQQVQRVLDAAVVNPEVTKEINTIYRGATTVYEDGFTYVHHDKLDAPVARAEKNLIPVSNSDYRIQLNYRGLLSPDALKTTTDNPDEAAFLQSVARWLENDGVWLQFRPQFVRDPEDPSRFVNDPRAFQAWLTLGPQVDGSRTIPVEYGGMITRNALLGIGLVAAGNYDRVYGGPVKMALKREIAALQSDIDEGSAEYWRLRRLRTDMFIRSRVTDVFGGADFPDYHLWDVPRDLLGRASVLESDNKIQASQAFLVAAALATRNSANLLAQYGDDVQTGGNRVVKVLQVAKKAGEVAQVALTVVDGVGVVRGAASVIRTVRAAEAGETVVISITRGGVTAERFVGDYAAKNPAVAAELGKISLGSGKVAARELVGAERAEEAITDANKFIEQHPPGPVEGEIPGHRSRPVGEHGEHKIAEVEDPITGDISCELESPKPHIPVACPRGLGKRKNAPAMGESQIKPSQRSGAKVDMAVQEHKVKTAFREGSGTAVQSAHMIPSAAARELEEYSRNSAITALLPRELHKAFDDGWKAWAHAQAAEGITTVKVEEFLQQLDRAAEAVPELRGRTSDTMSWLFRHEAYQTLGLKPTDVFRMPFAN